ncbi:hypothetical protein [Candidatus Palauibacter sp.]|uniref:hypothetical protein n=1 Tax=Candidatus Palauibacter sp. TaxID=3101350 RepID=UPI003B024A9E
MSVPTATRPPAGADQVRRLMRRLGGAARSPGRIYLVGGSSAVLVGWRETTVDVDLKLDPEPAGVFEAIEPALVRYPALDPASFRDKVSRAAGDIGQ